MNPVAPEKIDALQAGAESWSAGEVVCCGLVEFHPHAAIASSCGVENVALIDIAARVGADIRAFPLEPISLLPKRASWSARSSRNTASASSA